MAGLYGKVTLLLFTLLFQKGYGIRCYVCLDDSTNCTSSGSTPVISTCSENKRVSKRNVFDSGMFGNSFGGASFGGSSFGSSFDINNIINDAFSNAGIDMDNNVDMSSLENDINQAVNEAFNNANSNGLNNNDIDNAVNNALSNAGVSLNYNTMSELDQEINEALQESINNLNELENLQKPPNVDSASEESDEVSVPTENSDLSTGNVGSDLIEEPAPENPEYFTVCYINSETNEQGCATESECEKDEIRCCNSDLCNEIGSTATPPYIEGSGINIEITTQSSFEVLETTKKQNKEINNDKSEGTSVNSKNKFVILITTIMISISLLAY